MRGVDVKSCRKRAIMAKNVPNYIGGQLEKEKRERLKHEEKVRKANDPESIKKNKLVKIYQLRADAEKESGVLIADCCKQLKQEIFDLLTEGVNRKDSFLCLKEKINYCLELLKEYRKVVENKVVNERAQATDYNLYEQLFNNLIEYNVKFILFAPKKCFTRTVNATKINTLSPNDKKSVLDAIEILKVDENADYVSRYTVCEIEPNEQTEKADKLKEKLNQAKETAIDQMEQMADSVSSNLYKFIVDEYQKIKDEKGEVSTNEIDSILNQCKRERHMLLSVLKDNEFVASRMKKRNINSNENLFNHLINLDVRFATKAPGKCFCRLDLDFKTLGEEEKDIVFDRICRYGLWNIPQFVENYHDVFAGQIAKKGNNFNQ